MAESAFVGTPPKTPSDLMIATGIYRSFGRWSGVDPSRGVTLLPVRPPDDNDENKTAAILAGTALTIITMFVVTIIRLLLRLLVSRMTWGWDDWTVLFGVILALGAQIANLVMATSGGGGKHIWDVTYEEFRIFVLFSNIFAIFFYCAVGTIQISIVCFNLRLTAFTARPWRIFNQVLLILLIGYVITAICLIVFGCLPVGSLFDIRLAGTISTPPKCISVNAVIPALSITHTILDFALLTTPIVFILKVKMRLSDKVRLVFLFSLGFLSCAASVGRITARNKKSLDLTYDYTLSLAFNCLDITVAVLVASLPVLNSFFFSRRQKPLASVSSGKGSSHDLDSLHSYVSWVRRPSELHMSGGR